MAATTVSTFALDLTQTAAEEVKKFMASEEGLPETAGLGGPGLWP